MPYQNYWGAWLQESGAVRDWRNGTSGNDWMYGTDANDSFIGNGGWDHFFGGRGDDLYWNERNVIENANEGVDTIRVWQSATLPANVENLQVFGQSSAAVGNAQDNIIQGQDNEQFIHGGHGADVLLGGSGKDTFIVVKGEGSDVIVDFEAGWGAGDVLRLQGSNLWSFDHVKAAMRQQGSDVVLDTGGEYVLFRNMTIDRFAPDDFQYPLNYGTLGNPTFVDNFDYLKYNDPRTGAPGWEPHYGHDGETGFNSFTLIRNGEQQIYTSPRFQGSTGSPIGHSPFSIDNGVLNITAERASADLKSKAWGYEYTSGVINSRLMFSQKYGYFEMRADLPEGQGLWPAFWMMRPDSWVELNVMEAIGSEPNMVLNATHSSLGHKLEKTFVPNHEGYHTYGALWGPTEIVFFVDGVETRRMQTPPEMHEPMYMILNMAVGGNWPGSPDGSTPFPSTMKVDYVKVWNLPGTNPPPPSQPAPPPAPTPTPTPTPTPPPPSGSTSVTTAAQSYTLASHEQSVTLTGGGQTVTGNGLDNRMVSSDGGNSLNGGAGADTLVAGKGGSTGDRLTGGDGGDVFAFEQMPWHPGQITDFVVGTDRIDISGLLRGSGYTGSDPVRDGYVKLTSNGKGGTWLEYDADGAGSGQPWAWRVVELPNVAPSTALATLQNAGGSTPPPAGGGGGGSTGGSITTAQAWYTLSGSEQNVTLTGGAQNVTGNGMDNRMVSSDGGNTLSGQGGADTLVAGKGGATGDTLAGGEGGDVFAFNALPWSPARITDFAVGVDRLDLSGLYKLSGYTGSDPIGAGYLKLTSNGKGGTWVEYDQDAGGSGQQWPWRVVELQNVAPTTSLSTLVNGGGGSSGGGGSTGGSSNPGQVITAHDGGQWLFGTSGDDTFYTGRGGDGVISGGGADKFVIKALPWKAARIKDFQDGSDRIDISGVLDTAGYFGDDPVGAGYLKIWADGPNSEIYFDQDGWGGSSLVTHLLTVENTAPSQLTSSDWIF